MDGDHSVDTCQEENKNKMKNKSEENYVRKQVKIPGEESQRKGLTSSKIHKETTNNFKKRIMRAHNLILRYMVQEACIKNS